MPTLEQLNKDFQENVLPHLFKTETKGKFLPGLYGHSGNSYNCSLSSKAIFDIAPDYFPNTRSIIHFTSLPVLHSILNDIELRLYSMVTMNDSNEFSLVAKEFGYNEFQLELYKKQTYLMSFCNSDLINSNDILLMWKLYGHGGNGCLIEFEIDYNSLHYDFINFANVIYTKPDYSDFFKANEEFEVKNKLNTELKELIRIPACFHKKPIYKHEKEIRLVLTEGHKELPQNTIKNSSSYKYGFTANGNISNYYKLPLYSNNTFIPRISIKRIQLGYNFNDTILRSFRNHITKVFWGINEKLNSNVSAPAVEISNLKYD